MKIRKCKYNFGNNNDGVFSTINGYATETNNFGETAVGILNKSTLDPDTFTSPDVVTSSKATLFSVGNGSDNVRKNAFEIKANGDTYINGVGGYDGTNSEEATSIADELQGIRDNIGEITSIDEALDNKVDWQENKTSIYLPVNGSITALRNDGQGGGVLICQRSYDDEATYVTEVGTTMNNLTLNSIERPKIDFADGTSQNVAYESEINDINQVIKTLDDTYLPKIFPTASNALYVHGATSPASPTLVYSMLNVNGITLLDENYQSRGSDTELFNTNGGTVSIDDITSQVDLSGYLPLTGGELTGDLKGTNAEFQFLTTTGWFILGNNIIQNNELGILNILTVDTTDKPLIHIRTNSADLFTVTKEGIKLGHKTDTNLLLNAAGSTTSVSSIATQVQAAIVDSAPETLDTLNELAAALGDDPNFATTVTNQIAQKADKTTATTSADGLMSAADKQKLDGLSNYTLPTASATQLGGVRVGDGLEITGEGVLNCTIDPGSGTVSWDNIQGKPTFSTVATSGLYSDLTGTPDLSNYATSTQLTSVAGSNTYTGANYISKEANLTDAVMQLDEEIKAVNDNVALEHANAEATYVKKAGDTITGDLTVSGGKTILFEGADTAADNRRLRIGHKGIDILARRDGEEGWANSLFTIYDETGDTKLETALGAWGEGDQINYLYIGGTYNNPKVVVTRGGKLGVGQNYASEMLEVNGNAKATKFIGPLQGNADTATKATQDANGDIIADTYAKKTQLKTINSQSLLGEGNIEIQVEGGGITDAPSNNKLYGRKNAQWTEVTVPEVEVPTKVSELTNDSGFQTEAQVSAKISALVDSAPETLDTLNELAAALGDDPNFATTITTQLGNKLDTSTYNSDKATFALKSELPDMSNYALKSELPSVESITTTDIDALFS